MPFGSEGLAISWIGPAPKEARVGYADARIFDQVARAVGRDFPKGYPEKYAHDLQEVDLFNPTVAVDVAEAVRWHTRHLGDIGPEPRSIFEDYVRGGHVIFGTLIQHPPVTEPLRYAACSVVLQRGVIVMNPARQGPGAAGPLGHALRQTLYLKSYMHSARDAETFVNFVPYGGIRMSFFTDHLWFPLELTRVIHEPASYVVLDILSPDKLDPKSVLAPFRVEEEGSMQYDGQRYRVTRVGATLSSKRKSPDLKMAIA